MVFPWPCRVPELVNSVWTDQFATWRAQLFKPRSCLRRETLLPISSWLRQPFPILGAGVLTFPSSNGPSRPSEYVHAETLTMKWKPFICYLVRHFFISRHALYSGFVLALWIRTVIKIFLFKFTALKPHFILSLTSTLTRREFPECSRFFFGGSISFVLNRCLFIYVQQRCWKTDELQSWQKLGYK